MFIVYSETTEQTEPPKIANWIEHFRLSYVGNPCAGNVTHYREIIDWSKIFTVFVVQFLCDNSKYNPGIAC